MGVREISERGRERGSGVRMEERGGGEVNKDR